jgi:hypothetical protein
VPRITRVYVFIDDSGDAGFKLEQGSSTFFVIACCVFETAENAELTSASVKQLRDGLRRTNQSEFKFSKTKLEIQRQFFKTLDPELFFVRSIVVDKSTIFSEHLKTDHESFYNYVIQLVLAHSGGTIKRASVRIDGSGGRAYRTAARKYLLAEVNKSEAEFIRKVSYVKSHCDFLIQVADMFAGCIRRSNDSNDKNQVQYQEMLKPFTRHEKADFWKFR